MKTSHLNVLVKDNTFPVVLVIAFGYGLGKQFPTWLESTNTK
jgi:hypothetical protein